MSYSSEKQMIVLRSSDGEMFEVETAAAVMSTPIRIMLKEEDWTDQYMYMYNVDGKTLSKVLEFCKKHAAAAAAASSADGREEEVSNKGDLKKWDAEFIQDVDQELICELMMASNYMDIPELLDLCYQKVADTIKDMTVEEVREFFGIENDYTPEEEAELRREHQFADTIK